MTIKELLGVPEKTLLSFVKSAYKLNINPLPLLRKRFPGIPFKFTCSDLRFCSEEVGKPYVLVYYDGDVVNVSVEKFEDIHYWYPHHTELDSPLEMPEAPNI